MATDVQIGRNVARVRGSMSQKDLADAMRRLGFRWSQATVWAVEKGERPLRLAEAEAVGNVTDSHHSVLLMSTEGLDLVYRVRKHAELLDEIQELAYKSFELQRRLASQIDIHPEEWDDDDDSLDVIARNAADAAIEGLNRAAAHYRGLIEVDVFPDSPEVVPSGKYARAFMDAVTERLGDERARLHAGRLNEGSDGVDQTA